jgi:hypothetical protein
MLSNSLNPEPGLPNQKLPSYYFASNEMDELNISSRTNNALSCLGTAIDEDYLIDDVRKV